MQEWRVVGPVQAVNDIHFVDLLLNLSLLLFLLLPIEGIEYIVDGLFEVVQCLPALEGICPLVGHLPEPLLSQVLFVNVNSAQVWEPYWPVRLASGLAEDEVVLSDLAGPGLGVGDRREQFQVGVLPIQLLLLPAQGIHV